jgi:phosphate-selective porin OprO/OprP
MAVLMAAASVAWAQAPPTAGFDSGFFVQSADGEYRLGFGFNTQLDGRFALDDPAPIVNTFAVRKFRPTFTGRLTKYFEFKLMPDFGGGQTVVADAFLDTRFTRTFRMRIGKDKTPIGYELLVADGNVFFPERALASSLVPNRDFGVQAIGEFAGGKVTYAGGIFNGVPDGSSSTTDVDSNSDKDAAGRIAVQPWKGIGFHLGGSAGDQNGPLSSFKTSVGQTYYAYATGAVANGLRTRITPAAFLYYKRFAAFSEYMRSTQGVTRAGITGDVENHAMQVTTAYFLTGEPGGIGLVRPKHPFDPATGHWGAVQVLGRFSHLEVDGAAFVNGFAAAGASRRADQWTAALNWFPNQFVKWYATYEQTTFDKAAAGARPTEHVILFRAQLAF